MRCSTCPLTHEPSLAVHTTSAPTFRPARDACIALVLAGAFLHAATAQCAAANAGPYKHAKGYYTIELPDGFKMKSVKGDGVVFGNKSGLGWFRLDVLPVKGTLDIATQIPITTFKKVFPNAAPDGPPQDLEVNGVPARWMVYRGTMEAAGQTVPMVGLGGAITFPTMSVVLTTAVVTEEYGKEGEAIATSFKTIRAGDATPATVAAAAAAAGPSTFTNPAATMDLPAGWSVDGTPEAPIFANFTGPGGATLLFFKVQKLQVGKSGVATVPESSLQKAGPQFQLQPSSPYPLETKGGSKMTAARYHGPMVDEGREIDGRGYIVFGKNGKQNLFCIGITFGEQAVAAQEQMETIARSMR